MEADTMPRLDSGDGGGKDPHLPRLAGGDMGDRRDWGAWSHEMGGVARDNLRYVRLAGRQALANIPGSRWPVVDQRPRTDYMAIGPAHLPETAARLAMQAMDINRNDKAA